MLVPGQLQTITLVQYKGDASIITEVYVDGNLVIQADSVADRVKGLSELTFTHDDIIMIGASDLGNAEDGRNLFSGAIDSCYIYNYAKAFEADYTKVDEAIASTEELVEDDYTASSWKALQDVIAGVDRTLTVGQQDVVDAYADAIYKAVANLITKDMELNITISDSVATESDKGDSYKNVTWNATITLGENTLLSAVNEVATFKAYGVIYGMNEDAVLALANGEETRLAKKVVMDAAEGEEGIDVYTSFGFRLKNMAATANRSAMFYVTYEANGQTYTIYSPMGNTPTAE